ncbi:MAG: thioredoxin-dependent thiol peroxidase [Dehalococcoidia bacterium]|nr:thioredoxin-dependent thiol peroxidase [Dehalococcoidia bacterium]
MTLDVGDKAPDFTLPASDGSQVSLKGLAGKKVVLYFYPKDNTPGCTREACSLRDHNDALKKAGVVVLGVSRDSLKSHESFIGKHKLNFTLLSDEDHAMSEAYGAWGEKVMYGRKVMGMKRITYLLDEKGRIAKFWPKVSVDSHGADVLAAVKAS